MALFGNSIGKIETEIDRLNVTRATLEEDEQRARTELAGLRSSLGEVELSAILDGGDSGPHRARITALELEISAKSAAQVALVPRLHAAQRKLAGEQSSELRKKADVKQTALDRHITNVAAAREFLEDLEKCKFVPDMAPRGDYGRMPDGSWIPIGVVVHPAPALSVLMAQEIAELRQQAAAREKRPVDQGGHVVGNNLQELLSAIKPHTLAPTPNQIQAWFTAAETAADEDWERNVAANYARTPAPEHITVHELIWDGAGKIDRARSSAKNTFAPEVPRKKPDDSRTTVQFPRMVPG